MKPPTPRFLTENKIPQKYQYHFKFLHTNQKPTSIKAIYWSPKYFVSDTHRMPQKIFRLSVPGILAMSRMTIVTSLTFLLCSFLFVTKAIESPIWWIEVRYWRNSFACGHFTLLDCLREENIWHSKSFNEIRKWRITHQVKELQSRNNVNRRKLSSFNAILKTISIIKMLHK